MNQHILLEVQGKNRLYQLFDDSFNIHAISCTPEALDPTERCRQPVSGHRHSRNFTAVRRTNFSLGRKKFQPDN